MYKKSIGLRLLAFLVDFIMLYIIAGIMYLIFGFGTLVTDGSGFVYNLNLFEITLVSFIYFLSFAFIAKGKTIGKMVTRIEIRKTNFEEVPYEKIIIREAFKSLFMIVNFISFIVVLATKDKKSFHDYIVDTIVIRKVNSSEFIYNNPQQPPKTEESNINNE